MNNSDSILLLSLHFYTRRSISVTCVTCTVCLTVSIYRCTLWLCSISSTVKLFIYYVRMSLAIDL